VSQVPIHFYFSYDTEGRTFTGTSIIVGNRRYRYINSRHKHAPFKHILVISIQFQVEPASTLVSGPDQSIISLWTRKTWPQGYTYNEVICIMSYEIAGALCTLFFWILSLTSRGWDTNLGSLFPKWFHFVRAKCDLQNPLLKGRFICKRRYIKLPVSCCRYALKGYVCNLVSHL